jgi:D-tyrosyl-tRNA(Tyr) deacylase
MTTHYNLKLRFNNIFSNNPHKVMWSAQMILIVASTKDIASLNIKEQILSHHPFHETTQRFQQNPTFTADINGKKVNIITLNEELVKTQDLPNKFSNAKLIVFISRHSSQSGKPTLSVHTPGNFRFPLLMQCRMPSKR